MEKRSGVDQCSAGAPNALRKCALAVLGALGASTGAMAFEVDSGNPDLKVRWDNTVKYSAAWRTTNQSSKVMELPFAANADDSNRNFDKGLISNRLDLLSELDISWNSKFGGRVSGAAWYDNVYNWGTDNGSGSPTQNIFPAGRFPDATKKLHGRKAEFLDAFLFANLDVADRPLSLRAGRYSLLYGESLFFGGNGVAAAQAPIDVIKGLAVPGSQFKEIVMPVGQVSGQYQLNSQVSVGAYYQYEWRRFRLPGAGSYFGADFLDAGGTMFLGPVGPMQRVNDVRARDSGQWGAQIRFKPNDSDVELGLYAANYHAKTPTVNVNPVLGTYYLHYQENIKVYGASASTVLGETSVAGEVSVRRDTPLVPFSGVNAVIDPLNACFDNGGSTCVPLGNSAHAQVSAITMLSSSALWDAATFVGELAFNRLTSITRNPAAVDSNTTRDAWGLRFSFTPTYFNVMPHLDLSVPIKVGYSPYGRSAVFSFGPERGGDVSVGLDVEYQKAWKGSLTYTHFYGRAGAVITDNKYGGASPFMASFNQVFADRNFVSLSLQRTF